MVPDFQPYLESIRTTYAKWWQLYTLTDAEGKQQQAKAVAPMFDFGLMVQTVKREERERREEEKIERIPVLEGILQYANQQVLLVGRPGSGKSTTLARLMLEEATKSQARIPILVELRYWQGSIEQLIRDSLARHQLVIEQLEPVLPRSLLLFDGVNELPSEEARSQLSAFRRNHPKLPMIFTTRDLSVGGDLGIEQKLQMQPLTQAQMQAFIQAYVPEQAEQMLKQLKDKLREFGQTPLLLWMLCGLFQQTGTIPENLGMVFREFTQGYERYLKDDVRIESDRAWWKPVLQQLAWVMMQAEKPTEFRVAIREGEVVSAIAQFLDQKVPYAEDFARKCLRDLQKHHLIQVGTNQEELEFQHQLIQEYYAAEALLEQLPRLDDARLKQEFLNYLKWTEPIALMLALTDEYTQAVRVVKLALDDVDLMLGAKLAGEVKDAYHTATLEQIDRLEISPLLKIQCWAASYSAAVIPRLLKALEEDPEIAVRISAAEALGQFCSAATILGLFKALEEDPEIAVRASVAYALLEQFECQLHLQQVFDQLGGQDEYMAMLDKLINLSQAVLEEDPELTGSEIVVKAVGQLFRQDESSWILKLLKAFVEAFAEPILRELRQIDQSVLKTDLGTIFLEIMTNAFNQLVSQDGWSWILKFLEAIEYQESYDRQHLLELSDQLGSKTNFNTVWRELREEQGNSVYALLKALEHQDSDVRRQAASLLTHLGNPLALAVLWQLHYQQPDNRLWEPISAIQSHCQFYNYEIYQAYLEAQNTDRPKSQNSDASGMWSSDSSNITYDLRGATIGNLAHEVQGNQIVQPEEPQ